MAMHTMLRYPDGVKEGTPGGLESLVLPPFKDTSRSEALLFVSQKTPQAVQVVNALEARGYVVYYFPSDSLTDARRLIEQGYFDAVLVDVAGLLPHSKEDFMPGGGDVYAFVERLPDIDPDLRVFLFNASDETNRPFQPALDDLVSAGARLAYTREVYNLFNASDLMQTDSPRTPNEDFFRMLTHDMRERRDAQGARLVKIGGSLPQPPNGEEVGDELGRQMVIAAGRNRTTGQAFQVDSVSGGGITPIRDRVQYGRRPVEPYSMHIRRVSPHDASGIGTMYQLVSERLPGLITPVPRGYHQIDDRTALVAKTFVIATTISDAATVLHDSRPDLLESMHGVLFDKIAEWYLKMRDTVAATSQPGQKLAQKHLERLTNIRNNLQDIIGANNAGAVSGLDDFLLGAAQLYAAGTANISGELLVPRYDPKGHNVGFLTGMSLAPEELLVEQFTRKGKPDRTALNKNFAAWGYSVLTDITTFFDDILQACIDPSLMIPEAEQAKYVFETTEKANVDMKAHFPELLRQGIYKASFKTFIYASQAQANEHRFAVAKTRDYDFFLSTRRQLQDNFRGAIEQALKYASLAYRAGREEWASKPLERLADLTSQHFAGGKEQWTKLENGTRRFTYLRQMHGFFYSLSNPELSALDFDGMRKQALTGKRLSYS